MVADRARLGPPDTASSIIADVINSGGRFISTEEGIDVASTG